MICRFVSHRWCWAVANPVSVEVLMAWRCVWRWVSLCCRYLSTFRMVLSRKWCHIWSVGHKRTVLCWRTRLRNSTCYRGSSCADLGVTFHGLPVIIIALSLSKYGCLVDAVAHDNWDLPTHVPICTNTTDAIVLNKLSSILYRYQHHVKLVAESLATFSPGCVRSCGM